MKIVCVGGGPAGLFFSILVKMAFPRSAVTVLERNRPEEAEGFGVVFSRETLGNLSEADPKTYRGMSERFVHWDEVEVCFRGHRVLSTGQGLCALARRDLLKILHGRCRELGVHLELGREVKHLSELPQADLIVAADGIRSPVRDELAEHFQPTIEWSQSRYCWLEIAGGSSLQSVVFLESRHGLFQGFAYPTEAQSSTLVVQCAEQTWRAAGLERAGEAETVQLCEELFAAQLGGRRLVPHHSSWKSFPTLRNARWHHQNLVLLGDAAHSAHFSIGSGTKLAMEDAIALVEALRLQRGVLNASLGRYEAVRRPLVERLQEVAKASLAWFEHCERYLDQQPAQFVFGLMTRTPRVTHAKVKRRNPELTRSLDEWFAERWQTPRGSSGEPPPPAFAPFRLRGMRLSNRIALAPIFQGLATDGAPSDWHLVHLGSRALGGAGLLCSEVLLPGPGPRIAEGGAGLYLPEHSAAWKRIIDFVHAYSSAKLCAVLGSAEGTDPVRQGEQLVGAARLAAMAGFDMLMLSLPAHPEIFERVRRAFPEDRPLGARLVDWRGDPLELARLGCELVAISSPEMAERIRAEVKLAVMVEGDQSVDQANTLVGAGRADLCALAQPQLRDPYLALHAALELGYDALSWPRPYQ